MRAPSARDWARLHWRWYDDEVLRAVAAHQPCALALWPMLVCRAKEESDDKTNPNGVFKTTTKRLAHAVMADEGEVREAIELMIEGDMISVDSGSKLGLLKITVVQFRKWNSPRGSSTDRSTVSRENRSVRNTSATPVQHSATPLQPEETREEKTRTLTQDTCAPAPTAAPAPENEGDPTGELASLRKTASLLQEAFTNATPETLADRVYNDSRRQRRNIHPPRRLPLVAYERAAIAFVARVKSNLVQLDDPKGAWAYFLQMVPDHEGEPLELAQVDVVANEDERLLREAAERRAARMAAREAS